jgi:outer membrane protein
VRALLLALLLSPLPAAAARPLALDEAYRLALARSEELALRGADFDLLVAQAREIKGSILPDIRLNATETLQHVPAGASGLFLQPNREQAWVSARQPLFSGLREFLAFRSARDMSEAGRLRLERAKHLLYRDVARGYLDLLAAQDEIRIRGSMVEITEDRLKELRQRLGVGRSRRSELLAAEAQHDQAAAEREQARSAERAAQFQLRFLTGLEEDVEPVALASAPAQAPLDAALVRARGRADVEARRLEAEAAERNIKVASRARWPVIGADANYYLKRPPSFTDRVKWDVTITGTLDLFTGGQTTAQVRQQEARRRSARAAFEQAVRAAELEARTAQEDLAASARVTAALEKAASAAEANAKAQSEDYRLGQVTNLDVLGSLTALQQARLTSSRARLDAWWARARLEVAAGVPGGSL